jgi:hypothetical protein
MVVCQCAVLCSAVLTHCAVSGVLRWVVKRSARCLLRWGLQCWHSLAAHAVFRFSGQCASVTCGGSEKRSLNIIIRAIDTFVCAACCNTATRTCHNLKLCRPAHTRPSLSLARTSHPRPLPTLTPSPHSWLPPLVAHARSQTHALKHTLSKHRIIHSSSAQPHSVPYVCQANASPATGTSTNSAASTVRMFHRLPLYSEPSQLSVCVSEQEASPGPGERACV